MSVSTLSRIETDKQPIELETLISLCGILSIDPAGLVSSAASGPDAINLILSRLKILDRKERLQLWQQLAEASREMATNEGIKTRDLAMEVEELLAQVDYLRAEIEAVKRRIRR